MTIRVLLVDPDTDARERLADTLVGDPAIRLVGLAAACGEETEAALHVRPHVALVDLRLPPPGAVAAVDEIISHWAAPAVCMLIASEQALGACADDLVAAVQLGARGYLVKDAAPATVRAAVHALAGGGAAISSEFARDLVTAFDYPLADQIAAEPQDAAVRSLPRHTLTEDERRVLLQIGLGRGPDEIARRMQTSDRRVHTHLRAVLDKIRGRPGNPSDLLGTGVPRRPSPGGLRAAAAARPESQGR